MGQLWGNSLEKEKENRKRKERKNKNTKQHKLKAQSSEHTKERANYLTEYNM